MWRLSRSLEWNHFSNFGEGVQEQFCEIILKVRQHAKEMSFKDFFFFSSSNYLVQQSGSILELLVKWHKRNISVKLF